MAQISGYDSCKLVNVLYDLTLHNLTVHESYMVNRTLYLTLTFAICTTTRCYDTFLCPFIYLSIVIIVKMF